MQQEQVIQILQKLNTGDALSVDEHQLIEQWASEQPQHRELLNEVREGSLPSSDILLFAENSNNLDPLFEKFVNQYLEKEKKPVFKFMRNRRWVAAAVLTLAIGSGIYYFNSQSSKSHKSSQITLQTKGIAQEIPPGTNKAILTLSNGTKKELSPADNGLQLQPDALLLTTPRGGQYQAVLPDGSKVWLNAASSIQFPSKFTDKERRVAITGEVYFEIAKDASKPFKVSGGGQEVEVLGTSFNINIYEDEPNAKTTLVEGSVKINNKILQPGQAYINGKIIETNAEQDIAWKNGFFNIQDSDVKTVMRQLERWYNISVQYEGEIPAITFKGKIGRNLNLSEAIDVLSRLGMHIKQDGRTLIVSSS